MRWRTVHGVLLGGVLGALACGGTTPAAKGPEAGASKMTPKTTAAGASSDDGTTQREAPSRMPTAEPVGKTRPATGADETTDVVSGQCVELEKILTKLVFEDLGTKLPAKMDPAEREEKEKKNAEAARQAGGQFGEMCEKNMVGRAMQRKSLECLFKARTFAIFEECTR